MDHTSVINVAWTILSMEWIAFGLGFAILLIRRPKPAASQERRRDPAARIGIFFQALGFSLAWLQSHHPAIALTSTPFTEILGVGAPVLALGSLLMIFAAVRTLGRQWAVAARVLDDHRLITTGVYRIVRHPIYTGLFGMLIATALLRTSILNTIFAIILYMIGFLLRIRAEDQLLEETFGKEFDEYRSRVPTLIPFLGGRSPIQ